MEEKVEGIVAAGTEDIEDGTLLVKPVKPYRYEGKEYSVIDLTGLYDVTAADMIAVSRRLSRNGNVDFIQEMSLEYALTLAARATGKPLEFFEGMPPYLALAVKNRVTAFLYRQA